MPFYPRTTRYQDSSDHRHKGCRTITLPAGSDPLAWTQLQTPDPGRGSRWQYRLPAQISATDPLGPREIDTDRLQTIPAALAAWERNHRNLRRMLARTAADHLFRAATLLRQVPTADALVLAAAGTAEGVYALETSL